MQQLTFKMACFFLFYSLKKRLDVKRKSWGKKCEKMWKSVEKCRNNFALELLPFRYEMADMLKGPKPPNN